jgi:acyl-CoA synthetase (NDP forming)
MPCHASIGALGSPPDLAVLGVGTRQIEPTFDDALAAGVGAIALFDGLFDEADAGPVLRARLAAKAVQAGVPVLGGNCMGYYNFDAGSHISFQPPPDRKPGGISLIAHSGSVFVLLAANDPRYRFNLIVSPGQEINASVSDYMDFALEMPTTRVLALFLETVRDPAGFVAALEKARERDVPIVVLKVGRTEASARFAATHSGAIAGDDAAYEAVFERYGVARVATLDALMATAQVLAHPKRPRDGGLVALTDSGGLRELMIDLADDLGVDFTALAPATTAKLEKRLPGHLAPINPVDAAGSLTADFTAIFDDCLGYLMADPNAAIGLFEFEARDDFLYLPEFVDVALRRAEAHDTPLVVMSSFSATGNQGIAARLADAGVPLVNGVQDALDAVRHCLAYRELRGRGEMRPPAGPPDDVVDHWRARIAGAAALDEVESLGLLRDFGIGALQPRIAEDRAAALAAAEAVGYPLVMKTAISGIQHKTEVGGVHLDLADADAVARAWDDLAGRLGPRTSLAPMIAGGVELAFGMINDAQFGPIALIASGGRLIEVKRDRVLALAPVDAAEARLLIDRLGVRPLLDGVRGAPAADIAGLADAFARFSVLVATLGEAIGALDVNPVVVTETGCTAVDALVIGADRPADR